MNFDYNLFGQCGGKYIQYPVDGKTDMLRRSVNSGKKNATLSIFRQGTLIHYIYNRQLDIKSSSDCLGVCIIFNGVYIKDIKVLCSMFENIFSHIVVHGNILTIGKDGSVKYAVRDFSEADASVRQTVKFIESVVNQTQNDYGVQFSQNFCGHIGEKSLSLKSSTNKSILMATESNSYVIIDVDEEGTAESSQIATVISNLHRENESLKNELSKTKKQKKQYRLVFFLFCLICACGYGLYYYYNTTQDNNRLIDEMYSQIENMNNTIEQKKDSIRQLEDSLSIINNKYDVLISYEQYVGASPRKNDSYDNAYIMWLKAEQAVKINSFFVRPKEPGSVVISLYDEKSNLISNQRVTLQSVEFTKVDLDNFILHKAGKYYMRITSNDDVKLQYHSTIPNEYDFYSKGVLKITGCCSYLDRDKEIDRNKTSWYQYFYGISYTILNE